MDRQAFEQHILDLVHRFGVQHLTTERVAAEFGISDDEAERRLDELVTTGTLELDTDNEGNLFYYAPGQHDGGVFAGNHDVQINRGSQQSHPGNNPYGSTDTYGPASQSGQYPPPGYEHRPPQPPGQRPSGQRHSGPWGPQQQDLRPLPPQAQQHQPQQQQRHRGQHPQPPGYGQTPFGPQRGPYRGGPQHAQQQAPYNPYQRQQDQFPVPYQQGTPPAHYHKPQAKNPTTAALLSFFPGAGQLYNGQFGKAFFFFFLTSFFYTMPPFGFLMGMLPHAWSVLDAAASARRSNYGTLPP